MSFSSFVLWQRQIVVLLAVGFGFAAPAPSSAAWAASARESSELALSRDLPALPASAQAAPGQAPGQGDAVPPPRTSRSHIHVFLAFAAAWLLLMAYASSVGRRFGRLEEEVRRLRGG